MFEVSKLLSRQTNLDTSYVAHDFFLIPDFEYSLTSVKSNPEKEI